MVKLHSSKKKIVMKRLMVMNIGALLLILLSTAPLFAAEKRPARKVDPVLRFESGEIDPAKVGVMVGTGTKDRMAKLLKENRHLLVRFAGPLTPAERESLRGKKLNVQRHVQGYTYWVTAEAGMDDLGGIREGGGIRWIYHPVPRYKLSPAIKQDRFPPNARFKDGTVTIYVLYFSDLAEAEVMQKLSAVPGVQEVKRAFWRVIAVRVPRERIESVAALDVVEWIEPGYAPDAAHNVVSAQRIHADSLQIPPLSLDGAGFNVGIWDGGSVGNHADFGTRVHLHDASASVEDHSTHVAGTLGGSGANDATARGMASGIEIHSWDFEDDYSEMVMETLELDMTISNHSYGRVCGWEWNGDTSVWEDYGSASFGNYESVSEAWDSVVEGMERAIFKSAGNDRDDGPDWPTGPRMDGPYDLIPPKAVAKNVITIGATTDTDAMTDFSCWGPTDDGRIKPDLCANGVNLRSTLSDGACASPPCYGNMGGTSMATPSAAGAGVLLSELFEQQTGNRPRAQTLKALLIHGAQDLGRTGPDYEFGWGLIDAEASARLITRECWERDVLAGASGETDTFEIEVTSSAAPLRVTMVWTDPPALPYLLRDLVHDLDLRLFAPDNTFYYPWRLDPWNPANPATRDNNNTDNVEQVVVNNPMTGTWTIKVRWSYDQVAMDGQSYTLVCEQLSPYTDIGLQYYDGSNVVTIACQKPGTITSPLRIAKAGEEYGIVLVPPSHPRASGIIIDTPAGLQAWRKLDW